MNNSFKGTTPLHIACYTNNCAMAKLLLNNGADASIVEKRKRAYTTLHVAAIKGNQKMMELLIDHGFDLEKLVNAEAIEREFNFMPVFLMLCRNGNVKCLEYLLSVCGFVDTEAKDFHKRNGIFLSILFEQVSMLEFLITKVYDKNRLAKEVMEMIEGNLFDQCEILLDTAKQAQVVKCNFFGFNFNCQSVCFQYV